MGSDLGAEAERAIMRVPPGADCSPKPSMRQQLPAYLSEFAGTAIMMAIGVGAIALFWAPGSPLPRIEIERLRLLATGLVFAGGATLVVYSPLGQISGAHLNPAVTCAFWRLRRIGGRDAAVYAIAQTLGAIAGVAAVGCWPGTWPPRSRWG